MTIIGHSAKIQEVLRTVELVAVTDVPVLLKGEIGTGKKLFSQHIHKKSNRKKSKLINVNCSSLPEKLAESMLFGNKDEKSKSYFVQAQSGTLFLDNVSALSLSLQQKLLHYLESGEIQALGEATFHEVDVRLIVATHKNLYDEVKAGNFHAELFYRLNVIPVELPSLKEREGDVRLLIEHFFRELVREQHQAAPSFTKNAFKQIMRYSWSGNVRELKNFCERMFILFSGKEVDITNLPQEIRHFKSIKTHYESPFNLPASGIKLELVEVDLIQQALQTSNGNKSHAARLLGLTRDTFLYRLKKYSIDF